MNTLTPSQAAAMARGVYSVRTMAVEEAQRLGTLGTDGLFRVGGKSGLRGTSGAVLKAETGFGYLAEGEGIYQGEVACVTRGTASNYDWATDANIAMQFGPSGRLVHAGFNETWRSFSPQVRAYLRNRNPSQIHCIGHSLGGALAFLNADYFLAQNVAPVKVYSFGAPRVGLIWFASNLTRRLGATGVYRVSHAADPVPMIPLFPFCHVPAYSASYELAREQGAFIRFSAHTMATSYLPGVHGKTWGALRHQEPEVSDAEVNSWLQLTREGRGVLAYSAEALRMIGRLLRWMLRKAGSLMAGTLGLSLTLGATLLDQLAWMIGQAITLSKELAVAGAALARGVFAFLGYVGASVGELTARFLRWLLQLLLGRLGGMAAQALARP